MREDRIIEVFDDTDLLIDNGLSILRVDHELWTDLQEKRGGRRRFSRALSHTIANSAKKGSVAILSLESEFGEAGLMVALVRYRRAVSTLESLVVFDLISEISPLRFSELLEKITEPSLQGTVRRFAESAREFEKISPVLSRRIIDQIVAYPENRPQLQRIIWQLRIPTKVKDARVLQMDALKLALQAFGRTDTAIELSLKGKNTALAGVRIQEDAVIEHDARWIEGWSLLDSDLTGRAVFQRGSDRLEVITANKRPLEELFGVDLIYMNKTRNSIVMVQYKMMEPGEKLNWRIGDYGGSEREWIVRIDDQFSEELKRMRSFDKDLDPTFSYRLNPGAFYIKLVKRHADAKSVGIILSLGHLEQLITNDAVGPRGGLRISFRRLEGHYLRSSGLVELIHSGYIGTRGATSDHLAELVNAALIGGRAVVAAIQMRDS